MNPTITMTLDTTTYQSVTKKMQSSGGGFCIGPFSFGDSGSGSSTHTTTDTERQTNNMSYTGNCNLPQIIAIACQGMPEF